MKISFRQFLELDKATQKQLGNMNVNEELKPSVKNKKMDELQKLLSQHDWWWFMSDDRRAYKSGEAEQSKIHNLVSLLGKDGNSLYKQVAKKNGVLEHKKTNPPTQEKINEVKERHSIFPEMEKSERNISLGYGDGKVLANQHHFTTGNPYENTTKWQPPTKRNKYD